MEWVAEGLAHVSVGGLVVLRVALEDSADPATRLVYRVLAGVLVALAVLTSFTGAHTPVIWFMACPFILTGAAALLLAGSSLRAKLAVVAIRLRSDAHGFPRPMGGFQQSRGQRFSCRSPERDHCRHA